MPVLAVFWLAFAASQVLAWRRADGERRQQLKWLMSGAAVCMAAVAVSALVGTLDKSASPALAAVLYINEELSPEGRTRSNALTQELTRLAVQEGGTFYLTYARAVELDDLRMAYPRIDSFFQQKRRFDPDCRFSSRFFERYQPLFLGRQAIPAD